MCECSTHWVMIGEMASGKHAKTVADAGRVRTAEHTKVYSLEQLFRYTTAGWALRLNRNADETGKHVDRYEGHRSLQIGQRDLSCCGRPSTCLISPPRVPSRLMAWTLCIYWGRWYSGPGSCVLCDWTLHSHVLLLNVGGAPGTVTGDPACATTRRRSRPAI
jgi:hypothetical protein